jgi:uncharacterized protein
VLRVVFDTNTLFSGLGWRGRPYQCLELARTGVVVGMTCQEILDELAEKLRIKLHFTEEQRADTLADLLGFLKFVTITNTLQVVASDPDEDKIIECALVGSATYIVTGDKRHLLPLGQYGGIPLTSAAELLAVATAP